MAARHVEAIRLYRPHGPYELGGFCTGGYVAFEMARQLVAEGEVVTRLVLVDCLAVPFASLNVLDVLRRGGLYLYWEELRSSRVLTLEYWRVRCDASSAELETAEIELRAGFAQLFDQVCELGIVPSTMSFAEFYGPYESWAHLLLAILTYAEGEYAGQITHVLTREWVEQERARRAKGVAHLLGGRPRDRQIAVHRTPWRHDDVIFAESAFARFFTNLFTEQDGAHH